MPKLIFIGVLVCGCGTAPIRPMPADIDPASSEANEAPYAAPDNALSHDVHDTEEKAEAGGHEHHGEGAKPAAEPSGHEGHTSGAQEGT